MAPGRWREPSSTFLCRKKKKRKQRKNRNWFKAETIKNHQGFSYSGSSEIENFFFSPSMVTDNSFKRSIVPSLWKPFCRPWWDHCLAVYILHLLYIRFEIRVANPNKRFCYLSFLGANFLLLKSSHHHEN